METYKGDTPLFIKSNENNLEVRNYPQNDEINEPGRICKLNDFFTNNIDFELSKITILQLDNCDLNEIPLKIQKLNLKQLILTRNKLKEVPSCLYSGLNSLELLDLSHNFIKSFDIEPACSYTILSLKLNDNKISNLPYWILNLRCPKLEEIVYSNNHVTDLRTSHQLNIKKLEMCNCNLLDLDFPFFKSLRQLEELNLSNSKSSREYKENHFTAIDKLFINTNWNNLKVLNLSNNLMAILPEGINNIISLTELYLSHCDLSWIPSSIQYLTNLEVLDISNNSICSLPSELIYLEKLVIIRAQFNCISSVAEFSHYLEVLDLYSNCLEEYPACTSQVKMIDLEQNFFETENGNNYEEKRDQLREKFSYSRLNGSKELPIKSPELDDDYRHSLSESDYSGKYEDSDLESDNWDEKKTEVLKEKNPEITTSDDEWDGKADLRMEKKRKKNIDFVVDEEWGFSDAEE